MRQSIERKITDFLIIAAKELRQAGKMKFSLEALEKKDNAIALVNLCQRALAGDKQSQSTVEHMHFV